MKRSEMIRLINEWMKAGGYPPFIKEEADDLLSMLEFQGMVPPAVLEEVPTTAVVAQPMGYVEIPVAPSKVFVHKWEQE